VVLVKKSVGVQVMEHAMLVHVCVPMDGKAKVVKNVSYFFFFSFNKSKQRNLYIFFSN
jgi:hypothetical protein